MDSMRSLNTSLPAASSPRRQTSQPPEQLMQVFKQAALSVTNLYKAAASEHDKAYREGYQDALGELLDFLDKENLGLQDGEGWRVRQWATERYSGTPSAGAPNGSEDEEEAEEDKRVRSPTPDVARKNTSDSNQVQQAGVPTPTSTSSNAPARSESAPPMTAAIAVDHSQRNNTTPMQAYTVPQAEFTFQTSHHFPSVHDIEMESPDGSGTVHINVLPRSARNSRQNPRNAHRSSGTLGHGAGTKRRIPDYDFFGLGGSNSKDTVGGGNGGSNKRGRHS